LEKIKINLPFYGPNLAPRLKSIPINLGGQFATFGPNVAIIRYYCFDKIHTIGSNQTLNQTLYLLFLFHFIYLHFVLFLLSFCACLWMMKGAFKFLLLEHFCWITTQKLFFHETIFLFIVSYRSLSCDSICFHNKNNQCHHCTILLMKCKLLQCHNYTIITYWIMVKYTKVTRILCLLCSSILVTFLGLNLRSF